MTGAPIDDPLAMAQADLRELRHRLAVIRQQQVFLLSAIAAKEIEIDRFEHPEVGEALARLVGEAWRK